MRDRSAGNINNVFIYSMYCLGMTWPIAAHRGCHDSPRRLFWPLGALLRADDALPCAHLIQCVCFERRRVGQEPRRTFAACPRLLRETFLDPHAGQDPLRNYLKNKALCAIGVCVNALKTCYATIALDYIASNIVSP